MFLTMKTSTIKNKKSAPWNVSYFGPSMEKYRQKTCEYYLKEGNS